MQLRAAGIFILCLLCVAHTGSEMHTREIAESKVEPLIFEDFSSKIPTWETDETDRQSTDTFREKRALGLLLSGLAQIFGYTVTPIQIASLPNPNTTRPVMMMMRNNGTKQQAASSSRPATMNTTAPRLQETIRFTGVLNFGNNSDIIGHLQRYEQIFHGRGNNTTTSAMMTSKPAPTPMPSTTTTQTKAPLLAPFFVKIPLPIAPDLLPVTLPIEDFKLSYPTPLVSVVSESNEDTEKTPIRKEQETVYRNNENTERYTVEEKDIYDEKDVREPASKYNHQLYVDNSNSNQDGRYDEAQREQQKHVARLKEQEKQRDRDKDAYHKEDEANDRYRNREEEIANRNREYASKHESKEEKRYDDDDDDDEDDTSAERYAEEHASQANDSGESSKQPTEKEEDKTEGYANYNENDDSNKQFDGYKYPNSFDKYIETGYNPELPIGDYFHEGNPEMIRDSYGEVLNNKKPEDDRLSDYFGMFKHPYTNTYDSEEAQNPEDASKKGEKQTSAAHVYDEHLHRLQKLRDEYALPENKYEEYDINDEGEADRNDRESKLPNRTSARLKKPKTNLHGTKDGRAKAPAEADRNEVPPNDVARSKSAQSQEEIDFVRYTPLIVPVRYIDAYDKIERTQQRSNKDSDKSPRHQSFPESDSTVSQEKLALPTTRLPTRPRQLHEDERKELQIWPPPFDYIFDNTEPVNTIVSPKPYSYPPNDQYIVKNLAANDANNDNSSSEPPAGYVVVVGNPMHPYRYPYNVYYFPNEAANANENSERNVAYPQDRVYLPQQGVNQQRFIQASPNVSEYNLNKTARTFHNYYYQPQEAPINHLDRYRYVYEERPSQDKKSPNIDLIKSQRINTENWSSRIHRDQPIEQSPPLIRLQNAASLSQHVQASESPEKSRYSQALRRRRKNSRREDQHSDGKMNASSFVRRSKAPLSDLQNTYNSFSFGKADNSFGNENNSNVLKITEENVKNAKPGMLVAPELVAYHRNENPAKHVNEAEHNVGKTRECRNRMTRVSEQRRLRSNVPL